LTEPQSTVGIIIPSLQNRPDYLAQAIESALDCKVRQVIVISPCAPKTLELELLSKRCTWLESELSLPLAVNRAAKKLKSEITHFSWIGDDDLLSPGPFSTQAELLGDTALLIGWCQYIDEDGQLLWVQKPSSWRLTPLALSLFASPIGQPAVIISRGAFEQVGGLDPSYSLSFDQELFTKMVGRFGTPKLAHEVLASYRVHQGTLSENNWKEQLNQSAKIRRQYSTKLAAPLVILVDQARLSLVSLKRQVMKKRN